MQIPTTTLFNTSRKNIRTSGYKSVQFSVGEESVQERCGYVHRRAARDMISYDNS
jgi:hypothetical protein